MSRENETDRQDSYATARAADRVADRRTDEALSTAATAGELVSHEFADACSLGLWHTGGCES